MRNRSKAEEASVPLFSLRSLRARACALQCERGDNVAEEQLEQERGRTLSWSRSLAASIAASAVFFFLSVVAFKEMIECFGKKKNTLSFSTRRREGIVLPLSLSLSLARAPLLLSRPTGPPPSASEEAHFEPLTLSSSSANSTTEGRNGSVKKDRERERRRADNRRALFSFPPRPLDQRKGRAEEARPFFFLPGPLFFLSYSSLRDREKKKGAGNK